MCIFLFLATKEYVYLAVFWVGFFESSSTPAVYAQLTLNLVAASWFLMRYAKK